MQGFFRRKVHVLFLRTQVHRRVLHFEKGYQLLALLGIFDIPEARHYARRSDLRRIFEKGVERFFGPYNSGAR